jgi:2-polyprenyl-6-methoxyphenol hydroxylase-like FAD-dependent oxidoreductase
VTARYEAIVIGAGVAGSTAAILLAAAGWSVTLVEKRAFPRRKVCGECIAAPNLPLLEALGIGTEFAQLAGPPLTRVALCAGEDTLAADLPRFGHSSASSARALGRERLDTLLLQRAGRLGVTIRQPRTVRDVTRRGALYVCDIAAPRGELERIEAPVLIGAHGSWEPAPWRDGAAKRTRDSDLFAFKANFSGSSLVPGLLPVLAFHGGYGGMVIADAGMLTLACCVRRDTLRNWRTAAFPAAAGDAVQRGLEASCRAVREALAHARLEGPWLAVGPLRPGRRAAWTERTGFAVGNAAGEAHPILGEGISMAIQSSWLLCEHLVRERDALLGGAPQDAVAREYERDWRRNFGGRLRTAAVLAHLAMRPEKARALLPLLRGAPQLLSIAARAGGKVRPLGGRRPSCGTDRACAHTMTAATAPRLGERDL